MAFFLRNWLVKHFQLFLHKDTQDKSHQNVQVVDIIGSKNKKYYILRDKDYFIKSKIEFTNQNIHKGMYLNLKDYYIEYKSKEYILHINKYIDLGGMSDIPLDITNISSKYKVEMSNEIYKCWSYNRLFYESKVDFVFCKTNELNVNEEIDEDTNIFSDNTEIDDYNLSLIEVQDIDCMNGTISNKSEHKTELCKKNDTLIYTMLKMFNLRYQWFLDKKQILFYKSSYNLQPIYYLYFLLLCNKYIKYNSLKYFSDDRTKRIKLNTRNFLHINNGGTKDSLVIKRDDLFAQRCKENILHFFNINFRFKKSNSRLKRGIFCRLQHTKKSINAIYAKKDIYKYTENSKIKYFNIKFDRQIKHPKKQTDELRFLTIEDIFNINYNIFN